jgi:hypothetical protein
MSIAAKTRLLFSLQSSTDRCVSVFIQTINNEAKEKLGIHAKAIQLLKDSKDGKAIQSLIVKWLEERGNW